MAFSPISRAQNFFLNDDIRERRYGQVDPNMGDLDLPTFRPSTININIFGGFRPKASFGSGLWGGFSGFGFGIGGMFGGGRMTTGSFIGGLLGKALGTAMNVGTFALFNKIGGGGSGLFGGGLYNSGYGSSIYGGGYGDTFLSTIRPGTIAASTVTPSVATSAQAGTTSTQSGTTATSATPSTSTTTTPSSTSAAQPAAQQSASTNNNQGNTTVTPVTCDDGTPTAGYLIELINGNTGGNFVSGTSRQNGETLNGSNNKMNWVDGTNNKSTNNDIVNAVKLGTANGENGAQKDSSGYPTYFTMTDYRSHNEYTFVFSRTDNGHVYYKWDKEKSDLTKDDADKYNSTNWDINENFEADTEFEVTIKNGKIYVECNSGEVMSKKK